MYVIVSAFACVGFRHTDRTFAFRFFDHMHVCDNLHDEFRLTAFAFAYGKALLQINVELYIVDRQKSVHHRLPTRRT